MKLLTAKQVIIRIMIITAVVETLIMLALGPFLHRTSIYSHAIVDSALLAMLATPLIYIWIIKPFVNDRNEAIYQLEHLAHFDPLTQLANRRLFSDHLEKALAGSIRHKDYAAVLLIDLDGFKFINDSYGHSAGDAVLVEVAERLRSIVRDEDIVSRLGGDEFVVLINRLGADESAAREHVLLVADRLVNSLDAAFDFDGKTLRLNASIGIRLLGFYEQDTETVIKEADIAMYRAKQAGGAHAAIFEK